MSLQAKFDWLKTAFPGVARDLSKYVHDNKVGNSTGGPIRDAGADPEGGAEHKDELLVSASTRLMMERAMVLLHKQYPGFRWALQGDDRGGVLNVFCRDFHDVWGFRIRYDDVMNDTRLRAVSRAGSEILRRFRYPGIKFVPELMAAIARGPDGQAIPDLSDKGGKLARKTALAQAVAEGRMRKLGEFNGRDILIKGS